MGEVDKAGNNQESHRVGAYRFIRRYFKSDRPHGTLSIEDLKKKLESGPILDSLTPEGRAFLKGITEDVDTFRAATHPGARGNEFFLDEVDYQLLENYLEEVNGENELTENSLSRLVKDYPSNLALSLIHI